MQYYTCIQEETNMYHNDSVYFRVIWLRRFVGSTRHLWKMWIVKERKLCIGQPSKVMMQLHKYFWRTKHRWKKTGLYLVGNLFCMLYFAKATFIYGFQKIRPNSMFWHLNYQVSLKAQNGETPLHLASRHGHVSLAQILLEHGAAANETSLEGKQTVVAGTESDVLTCLPRQWMTIAYYGRTVWGSESWLYCYVCYIMFCYSTCLIILI